METPPADATQQARLAGRNRTARLALAGVALAGLLGTFLADEAIRYAARTVEFRPPDVEGRAGPVEVCRLDLDAGEGVREVAVSLEFLPGKVSGYEDVFQTADRNTGLRLELWSAGAMLLVGDPSGAAFGLNLSAGLKLHEWNRLEVRLDPSGVILARLNGMQERRKGIVLRPQWDRILVGSGFSGLRPFHGEVRNARIAVRACWPRPGAEAGLLAVRILLALLAAGLVVSALPRTGLSGETKAGALSALVLAGFTAAVFFHYTAGGFGNLRFPWTTFLCWPPHQFSDFFDTYWDTVGRNPYGPGLTGIYPPFCYLALAPLTLLGPDQAWLLLEVVTAGGFFGFWWYALRGRSTWVRLQGALCLGLLTYPAVMVLDRGNVEGLLFLVLALFLFAYQRGWYRTGAALLGLAAALKILPALFLLLFVADRRYKEALLACVLTGLFTAAGMCWLEGGLVGSCLGFPAKLATFDLFIKCSDRSINHASTFCGLIRLVFNVRSVEGCVQLFEVYKFVCAGLLLALAAYVVRIERAFHRRVALLTFAMLLLPPLNYDYRLILLYIPLVLFLNQRPGKLDSLYVVLFGLLLVPKAYFIIREQISISSVLNPILMLSLVALLMYERRLDGRAQALTVSSLGPAARDTPPAVPLPPAA